MIFLMVWLLTLPNQMFLGMNGLSWKQDLSDTIFFSS